MSVAEIATHYGNQLSPPAWRTAFQRVDGSTFAILRASGATADGTPIAVVLAVTRLEGIDRTDVALRLIRNGRAALPPPAAGRGGGRGANERPDAQPPAPLAPTLNSKVVAEFPKDLIPAGAEIKGAYLNGPETTVVAESPTLKLTDIPRLVVALENAGWLVQGTLPGGFVVSREVPASYGFVVCRGSSVAMMDFLPRSTGGHNIVVKMEMDQKPCATLSRRPFADVAMPLLVRPAEASFGGSGGGGGLDNRTYNARLVTTMAPAAIGAHFLDQMTAEGWKRTGGIDEPNSVWAARFVSASTAGQPITAILMLTALPGSSAVDACLRVAR
ncbi:MAG TPA: hypothetical protein VFV78_04310 [Vicinamibacterales bacterium]|nr:hypothetical protein [Vicinamibacterales bacterium]